MLLFCKMCSKTIRSISSHYGRPIFWTMLYFVKFPGKSFLECEIISSFLPRDGHTRKHTHTQIILKKKCDVSPVETKRCSWHIRSCVHVKETELSKQSCVHKKSWEGFLSYVVAKEGLEKAATRSSPSIQEAHAGYLLIPFMHFPLSL